MLPQLHTIGRVAGKHGFHGELVLHFENDNFAKAIAKGDFLFVVIDGKGVPFLIENYLPKRRIVKLQDVNSPEDASEIEGLPVQTENVIQKEESDEFDPAILVGWQLLNADDSVFGEIMATEEYPAGTMLLIKTQNKEVLIPLEPDWILELNEETQILVMEIPEGLSDL